MRVRESHIQPSDRVLVRNVGVRGKWKIADRWEKDVYLVVDQPNKDISVYILKREHGRGKRRMLHRNLLLPFMAIPASKSDLLDTSVLPVNTADTAGNTGQDDLGDSKSNNEVSSADTGNSGTQTATQSDRYVIPPRRPGYQGSTLNPLARPFIPRFPDSAHGARPRVLPARAKRKPQWQTTSNWVIGELF